MIETSVLAWAKFLLLVLVSSGLGVAIASRIPFSAHARERSIPLAFGAALAPFLLGLAGVVALGVFGRAGHGAHYLLCLGILGLPALALASFGTKLRGLGLGLGRGMPVEPATRVSRWFWPLVVLLGAWLLLLCVHAFFIPLTQSDSLEYSMAGRVLFQQRELAAYPPVDPLTDPAGFFGPWTHPPLYPALIYLAYVCQDHVRDPGLMRLIAPWALFGTTALVFALGALRSRVTGVLAALLLLSPPLLFLGADSALLDSIPALAMGLALSALVSFERGKWASVAWLGVVVGLGLWSHSQAVLLLPLIGCALFFARDGFRDFPGFVRAGCVFGLCALAVGGWPYVENLRRTGEIISDNPAVFALPQLDWEDYFRKARDFDSMSARIQYGVFKGWFALESYAFAFWFLLFGGCVAWWARRGVAGNDAVLRRENVETAALAILGCYFLGVVVSTAMGIDLMIKTERYLLIIMPCVALLGAYGLGFATAPATPARARILLRVVLAGFVSISLLQFFAMTNYRWRAFNLTPRDIGMPLTDKLSRWPPFGAIDYLRRESPDDAVVLSLKPSDMFYSGRRMVSFLDPRLIPMYESGTEEVAFSRLRELGISYVHLPDYSIPPLYNSPLHQILAAERYSRLVHSKAGYQIYALNDLPRAELSPCPDVDIGPAREPWFVESGFVFGGRKRLFEIAAARNRIARDGSGQSRSAPFMFQRDFSTRMASELLSLDRLTGSSPTAACKDSREVRVEYRLTGKGFAHLFVEQLAADGRSLGEEGVGGTSLEARNSSRVFARRLVLRSDAAAIRVSVEYRGTAAVALTGASVRKVSPES